MPGGGLKQLESQGNTLIGYELYHDGEIERASVRVNAADPVNSYRLSIRINGAEVGFIDLPAGATGAFSSSLDIYVLAGDVLTAFLVRTAGAGTSAFTEISAVVEVYHYL